MTTVDSAQKERRGARYVRIAAQLEELFVKVTDPQSRMATAAALLHSKMQHFFWTGFYRVEGEDLVVGPYQGPLACMLLEREKGVCWATVRKGSPILVADVHAFEGHIACDSRSQSEVVVPVFNGQDKLVAVMDVDSDQPGAFSQVDVDGLQRICGLIYV